MSEAPNFCQRTGRRSPRQPERDRDEPGRLPESSHEVAYDFWAHSQAVCHTKFKK